MEVCGDGCVSGDARGGVRGGAEGRCEGRCEWRCRVVVEEVGSGGYDHTISEMMRDHKERGGTTHDRQPATQTTQQPANHNATYNEHRGRNASRILPLSDEHLHLH